MEGRVILRRFLAISFLICFFAVANTSIKQANASFDSPNESVVIKLALDTTEVAITRNGNREYAILDLAPFTQDERTMVPLRFIAESFGAKLLTGMKMQKLFIITLTN